MRADDRGPMIAPGPAKRVEPATGVRRYRLGAVKAGLAAVALGLVALVALWPQLTAGVRSNGDDLGGAVFLAEPGMTGVRYVGTDKQKRPFSVRADAVSGEGADSEQMLLEAPEASMTLTDGAWVFVDADHGNYDVEAKELELSGDVRLFHDSGYELNSTRANVDLEANVVSGDEPVDVQGPAGLISAEGFVMRDNGKSLLFTGKARMTILNNRVDQAP